MNGADYKGLDARWITAEVANAAGLRRIDSITWREMFRRCRGDMAGIIIPNIAPWAPDHIREYRERLDTPDFEYRADGSVKETNKYIQPPDRGNLVYFPPGVCLPMLDDATLPVIITEGEFKALALWRLANYEVSSPRFLPIATTGVYNWRGVVGKVPGPDGKRRDVKGVISEFERIAWKERRVIIGFDADSEPNAMVRAAALEADNGSD